VLHRPIETTRIFGNFEALFPKTPFFMNKRNAQIRYGFCRCSKEDMSQGKN